MENRYSDVDVPPLCPWQICATRYCRLDWIRLDDTIQHTMTANGFSCGPGHGDHPESITHQRTPSAIYLPNSRTHSIKMARHMDDRPE